MIEDYKITTYQDNVKDLPDRVVNSAAALKAMFDGRTDKEVKTKHNGLIDYLSVVLSDVTGNVLTKDNTDTYTPTGDYNPATKKYADELAFKSGSVASVFGRSGAVLAQASDYEGYYAPIGATKTEQSLVNGNIKIDGVEKTVYSLPVGHNGYSLVTHADGTATIAPYTSNLFGALTPITITLGEPIAGTENEYVIYFASGTTATVLTLPAGVKWYGGAAMTVEASKNYKVVISYNGTDYIAIGGEYA